MIDRLMSRGAMEREVLSTESYTPEQVIRSRTVVNPDGHELTAIFPPWHGGGWAFDLLTKRLVDKGHAVLPYQLHGELLKPDVGQVLQSFSYFQSQAVDQLNELVKDGKYQAVNLIGASLGVTVMAMVAEKFPDFSTISFIVGGSNLAYCMWNGFRTQHIRQQLEDKGWNYEKLDDAWQPLAPINHVGALNGKRVTVLASTTDEIIPASSQREFAEAVVNANTETKLTYTNLGHLASIGRYCFFGTPKSQG